MGLKQTHTKLASNCFGGNEANFTTKLLLVVCSAIILYMAVYCFSSLSIHIVKCLAKNRIPKMLFIKYIRVICGPVKVIQVFVSSDGASQCAGIPECEWSV